MQRAHYRSHNVHIVLTGRLVLVTGIRTRIRRGVTLAPALGRPTALVTAALGVSGARGDHVAGSRAASCTAATHGRGVEELSWFLRAGAARAEVGAGTSGRADALVELGGLLSVTELPCGEGVVSRGV